MNQVFAVLLCAAVLLGMGTQGIPTSGRGRCICPSAGSNVVPKKHLAKLEVYPANDSCDRVEIIVTKTTGTRECLNPESGDVRAMLATIGRNRASAIAGRRGKGSAGRRSPQ